MPYIFGPVPSRRLGLSLGIDLIPLKTCTYDCLYCQVGRTTCQTIEPGPFVPVAEVIREVKEKVPMSEADTVTLAGSGEPTLHSGIHQVIAAVREISRAKLAVLTNGSLFWKQEVRRRVLEADIIMPTFCSAFEQTYRRIHRPAAALDFGAFVDGLKRLRQDYKGRIFLEVVILKGINDTEEEIEGLERAVRKISPDKIQLNTVVRPPADPSARSLDRRRLEEIKNFIGKKAEIVAVTPLPACRGKGDSPERRLMDTVRRRPLAASDIVDVFGLSPEKSRILVEELLAKGRIRKKEQSGQIYYVSYENDEKASKKGRMPG